MARFLELGTVIATSSTLLKLISYTFLRWIPGYHGPPLIWSTFVVYVTAFYFEATSWSNRPSHIERTISAAGLGGRPDRKALPSPEQPKKVHNALWVVFCGLPSLRWQRLAWIGFAFNTAIVMMATDLVYRGPLFYRGTKLSFARVGYVDSQSAKILIREPNQSNIPVTVTYREPDGSWKSTNQLLDFKHATDYVQPVSIVGLRASTDYEFSTSSGHNGTFRTTTKPGHYDAQTKKFTFVSTSCIKAHFPYNIMDHPLRIPGFDHLAAVLPSLKASFMLFLGDFIYIDAPRRLGSDTETYRSDYRRVYSSPSWPLVSSLPWLHVMDDHEIQNDWDQGEAPPFPAAVDPFTHYQHAANPPPLHPNTTYYAFAQGPASFFMLDTRRHRTPSAGLPNTHVDKTMLGEEQLAAVRRWLAAPEPHGVRWKVLVSSVPFTRNWRVNADDTWGGYLAERQTILEAMWDAASGDKGYGIIVLSGDRHEFAATRFPAPSAHGEENKSSGWGLDRITGAGKTAKRWVGADGGPAVVHEFSCSPLSMFYLPFRSYKEKVGETSGVGAGGEDQQVAYLPDGNSKFGAIDMWEESSGRAKLQYRLFVDGKDIWSTVLTVGR